MMADYTRNGVGQVDSDERHNNLSTINTCNCRGAPCSRFNSWLLNGLLYKHYKQTNYRINGQFLQQVEVSL